eukprot:2938864-Rhodomonas_salina.1
MAALSTSAARLIQSGKCSMALCTTTASGERQLGRCSSIVAAFNTTAPHWRRQSCRTAGGEKRLQSSRQE